MELKEFIQRFNDSIRAKEGQKINRKNKITVKNGHPKPALYKGYRAFKKGNNVYLNKWRKLSIRMVKKIFKKRSRNQEIQTTQEHLK